MLFFERKKITNAESFFFNCAYAAIAFSLFHEATRFLDLCGSRIFFIFREGEALRLLLAIWPPKAATLVTTVWKRSFAGDENSKAVIKTKSHRFFRLKTFMWMLFFREARNFHIYSTRSDANVNKCKILEQISRIDDLWYDRLWLFRRNTSSFQFLDATKYKNLYETTDSS